MEVAAVMERKFSTSSRMAPREEVAADAAVDAGGVRDRRRRHVGISVPTPRAANQMGTRGELRSGALTAAQRQFWQRKKNLRSSSLRSERKFRSPTPVLTRRARRRDVLRVRRHDVGPR